ncbi:MAG: acyltransferase family protein [Prevotella sp.]|nr:acyltransferase family protein [Prevotella sp.]
MRESRIAYFDIAKGIGILSVVIYHVAEIHGNRGMMSFINTYFLSLFFFISGYLSIGKSFFELSDKEYIIKQGKHLLIPFFFVGSLYNLYQNIISGDYSRFFLSEDPKGGYWFLLVLFWFLLTLRLLKGFIRKRNIVPLLYFMIPFVLVVFMGYFLSEKVYYCLSLASYRRYYLVFMCGALIKIYGKGMNIIEGKLSKHLCLSYLMFATFYTAYTKEVNSNYDFLIWLMTNLSGCFFWIKVSNSLNVGGAFLEKIGRRSLGIYVVHFFIKRGYSEVQKLIPAGEIITLILIFGISIIILVTSYYLVGLLERNKIGTFWVLGK